MSRSEHTTRRKLREELRWECRDREEQMTRLRRLAGRLTKKRALKRQVREERRAGERPRHRVPIGITQSGPYVHYPCSPEELQRFLQRLPGLADGLEAIELCLGVEHQDPEGDLDPLVGRPGCEKLPEVYSGDVRGVYVTRRPLIRLYAYVYDRPAYLELKEIYLKLVFLSTFVHELAHHFDHIHRTARGRWSLDDEDKAEIYAEGEEHRLVQEEVLPFLREVHPLSVQRLEDWLRELIGVEIPFEALAPDPRVTVGEGVYRWIFPLSEAFEELMQDLEKGLPVLEARRNFAEMVHFGDQFELSLQVLDSILVETPEDVDTQVARADVLHHLERYPEALRQLEPILAEHPDHPEAWRVRGLIAWNL